MRTLDAPVGSRIQIGLRPEDVEIGLPNEGDMSHPWAARIERVEPIGHESLIHARLDAGPRIVARLSGTQLADFVTPGDGRVTIGFHPSRTKLFEEAGGRLASKEVGLGLPGRSSRALEAAR